MNPRALVSLALASAALSLVARVSPSRASGPDPTQPQAAAAASAEPDESILGTVEVNGSAEGLPPLPKLGVVPVVPTGLADTLVHLVVVRDIELSGQFEVLKDDTAPPGPFTHTTPLDLGAWRTGGAEYVIRVFSQPAADDSSKTELVGEAYLTPTPAQAKAAHAQAAGGAPPPDAKPAFRTIVPTATTEIRAASHRLVDQLLGALTGRPGGFASQMTYAEVVGRWRRIFEIDSDGFDLRTTGPSEATAISPAFGPGGQLYYALSADYSPFKLAFGPNGTTVPVNAPGSIMGLAFNADRSKLALTVMDQGKSALWVGSPDSLQPMASPPFANHPSFGPLGKIAYVAGTPVQRVYIDGKPVSPPGFMASAPVFCDTPQGLLVIYTVGVGAGADIIASDTGGGSIRRLTQHQGANTYAACSPDGRLVAFFSTGKKKGPVAQGTSDDPTAGLFVMPIQRPWLAKKISSEVGESLRWAPIGR
jgi:TolB protein